MKLDEYNVIIPTTDLEELEKNMNQWYDLPYDLKMRSNDECMKRYGCSVMDFYTDMKLYIMHHQDLQDVDANNIVKEFIDYGTATQTDDVYVDFNGRENKENLLDTSLVLQRNPYIVIIDPQDSIEEIEKKYDTFLSLNDKFRMLSNYYSYTLYNYNVQDMYDKLMSMKDEAPSDDESNVVTISSKIESAINCKYDRINKFYMENNVLEMAKFNKEYHSLLTESAIPSYVANHTYSPIIESNNDKSKYILPSVSPWFTAKEMLDNQIKFEIEKDKSYYKQIKEALESKDEAKILSLGWNPSVELNETTIEFARNRICDSINLEEVDITSIEPKEEITKSNCNGLYPIYLILGYESIADEVLNKANYNAAAITFDPSMKRIFMFDGMNNSFRGFRIYNNFELVYDKRFTYVNILTMFVDKMVYINLMNNCKNLPYSDTIISGFESIYQILTNFNNRLDPKCMNIIYCQFVDMIIRIASIDTSTRMIDPDKFTTNINGSRVFKIYSGLLKDYDPKKSLYLVNLLCDKVSCDTAVEKYHESVDMDYLKDKLTVTPVIVEK